MVELGFTIAVAVAVPFAERLAGVAVRETDLGEAHGQFYCGQVSGTCH
jgi:hypothetical protein